MPHHVGILVYNDTTSIVTRTASSGMVSPSIFIMKSYVSLIYKDPLSTAALKKESMYLEIGSNREDDADTTGRESSFMDLGQYI